MDKRKHQLHFVIERDHTDSILGTGEAQQLCCRRRHGGERLTRHRARSVEHHHDVERARSTGIAGGAVSSSITCTTSSTRTVTRVRSNLTVGFMGGLLGPEMRGEVPGREVNAQTSPSRDVVPSGQTGERGDTPAGRFRPHPLPESEQKVCKAFLLGLDESWTVVPSVPIVVDGHDCEIDVVLVSATRGVIAGRGQGRRDLDRQGRWIQTPTLRSRPRAGHQGQARTDQAAAALGSSWKACSSVTRSPCRTSVRCHPRDSAPMRRPRSCSPRHSWSSPPWQSASCCTSTARFRRSASPRLLAALRPDIALEGEEGQVLQWAGKRLDEETRIHLGNVRGLDKNERVLVTGGAGTGKTMLVLDWAKRAIGRGERTLVVCFNKPIADQLQRALDNPTRWSAPITTSPCDSSNPTASRSGEARPRSIGCTCRPTRSPSTPSGSARRSTR